MAKKLSKKGADRKEYVPSRRDMDVYEMCETSKLSQREIAKKFGISHQMVSKIRARVLDWTKVRHSDDALRVKAQITNRLDWVAKEAIEAWYESKRTKRKVRRKSSTSQKNGKTSEKEESLEDQAGDPRFLDNVIKTEALKAKIWGVDQPPEIAPTGIHRVAGTNPEAASDALRESLLLHIENLPGGIKFLAGMVARMPQLAPLVESMQVAQSKTLEGQVVEHKHDND